MLQVGQLGSPHMETSPCAAMVHSVLYGSAANMSSPYFRNLSMCQLPGQMGISMRGVHGDMRPGIQHRPCRHKGAEPLVSNLTWSRCGMWSIQVKLGVIPVCARGLSRGGGCGWAFASGFMVLFVVFTCEPVGLVPGEGTVCVSPHDLGGCSAPAAPVSASRHLGQCEHYSKEWVPGGASQIHPPTRTGQLWDLPHWPVQVL